MAALCSIFRSNDLYLQKTNEIADSASHCDAESHACPEGDARDDDDGDSTIRERACDSLMMCIITTLNQVKDIYLKC